MLLCITWNLILCIDTVFTFDMTFGAKKNILHLVMLQHIRQAVLQRSGSKSHMENVDEETEVKLAQVSLSSSPSLFMLIHRHLVSFFSLNSS